jgi:hypothetical protein
MWLSCDQNIINSLKAHLHCGENHCWVLKNIKKYSAILKLSNLDFHHSVNTTLLSN